MLGRLLWGYVQAESIDLPCGQIYRRRRLGNLVLGRLLWGYVQAVILDWRCGRI